MKPQMTDLDVEMYDRVANSLKAIAHPARLAMIDLLKDGRRMNVTQIHMALGMEQAVTSQHLSILREREILDARRQGKHSYYFLRHPCVIEVISLLVRTYEG
jgi:DNA-binding transcriptional ArsR family regulator